MQPPKVREVTRRLEREGWKLTRIRGDHRVYERNGQVIVVPGNPGQVLRKGTYAQIKKQAGW